MIRLLRNSTLIFLILVLFTGNSIVSAYDIYLKDGINDSIDLSLTSDIKKEITWYVDDEPGEGLNNPPEDFTRIQDAVDAANEGDTIFVYTGIYIERLIIEKRLNLIGENKYATIIDGDKIGKVIKIDAHSVKISGFTIQHAATYGLELNHCSNVTIEGNIICNNGRNNGAGFEIYYSSETKIIGNIVENNSYVGIEVRLSSQTTISRNILKNNLRACLVLGGSSNRFIENNFMDNKWQVYFQSQTPLDSNSWYGNYWYRWMSIFPRPIIGGCVNPINHGTIIWMKYDWNPASQPLSINE